MSLSAMEAFRENNRFLRSVAATTLFFFCFSFYSPTVFAVKESAQKQASIAREKRLDPTLDPVSQQLKLLTQQITEKRNAVDKKLQENDGLLAKVSRFLGLEETISVAILQESLQAYELQHAKTVEDFDAVRQHLKNKHLSPVIVERHNAAMARIDAKLELIKSNFALLEQAGDLEEQQAALSELEAQLGKHPLKRSFTPTNPNDLPWGTPNAAKTRKPAKTSGELIKLTGIPAFAQGTLLASNIITPDMLGQPGGPVAEDLTATIDAQITETIQTKAEELEYDPVKIYNWVRNTIEFIPSYGSIQGAEYTLKHGRGNAFDTASLLIALLRASNVPARYVYGTVDIPAEKVMNWVGGVNVAGAAQQIIGQGGIPNVATVEGGKIRTIELEHVWVEAWIDYLPSRGANHRIGDNWVPLDASFKQYEYTNGAPTPALDQQELDAALNTEIAYDSTQGYIQSNQDGSLDNALSNLEAEVDAFISVQNEDASLGDVYGKRTRIVVEQQDLSAGLPYAVQLKSDSFSALPSSLRHKFKYTLSQAYGGTASNPIITFERDLPSLAGKKMSLSFAPATEDDRDLLGSYLPSTENLTSIALEDVPGSVPGYLVNLVAEFRENDEVVTSAAAGSMGEELYETLALWSPSQSWQQAVNHPTAGEYRAIAVDVQGFVADDAGQVQQDFDDTLAKLESGDSTQFETLTKQQIIGDLLYATIYEYLVTNDILDDLAARKSGVIRYRLPSFGIFSTTSLTSYYYGVPRSVAFDGMAMDVDHLATQVASLDSDAAIRTAFVQASGIRSSVLEHVIPEQMYQSDTNVVTGISAIKALNLAFEQGQKIWTITSDNLQAGLAGIQLDSTIENEIRNAVYAGKVVTVHESPLQFSGGYNVGYLILDPETGAGAYKIASGSNGADIDSDFWSKFLGFFSTYGISLNVAEVLGLLLFGSIPKSWVGARPLLGSTNPLTSLLRGVLKSPLAKTLLVRSILIPAVTLAGVFIGFYNVTIMIQALFYAI